MAYDLDEQEQLDQIKAFWAKWGNIITWALTAVALIVAAYYGWQLYQRNQAAKAAPFYEKLETAVQANDYKKNAQLIKDTSATLMNEYSRTAYAQIGALLAAKANVDGGDVAAAKAQLQWAATNARDAEYQMFAKVRLAGVLLDEKDTAGALAALPSNPDKPYIAMVADRKGDILAAQDGKREEAITAYKDAYKALPLGASQRGLIQQKLQILGAEAPVEEKITPKAESK